MRNRGILGMAALVAVVSGPLMATALRAQEPAPLRRSQDATKAAQPRAAQPRAAQPRAGARPVNDQLFAAAAAAGGLAEVAASQLAAKLASDPEVKKFAQQMIADHSRANKELMALAAAKQIPLPRALDIKDQAAADRLSGLSGEEFDREYIKQQVAAHMDTVAEFRAEAERGQDPDLKAWAAKTLPALEHHLQMAQDLLGNVGGPDAGRLAPGDAAPETDAAPADQPATGADAPPATIDEADPGADAPPATTDDPAAGADAPSGGADEPAPQGGEATP